MKLFAITHINRDGQRQLTFANQGRNHLPTRGAAEKKLAAILENNNGNDLTRLYGDTSKMRVDEIDCYPSGDATGIYIDDPEAPFSKEMKRLGIDSPSTPSTFQLLLEACEAVLACNDYCIGGNCKVTTEFAEVLNKVGRAVRYAKL